MVKMPITLTETERLELESRVRSRSGRAGDARIARVVLLLAEGNTYIDIQSRLGCSASFVSRWKKRFLAERLSGLRSRPRGRQAKVQTSKMEAKILAHTQKQPRDGSTHWSIRRLGAHLGIHHMMVARTWWKAGIQPHRMKRYMASNDLEFEAKAAAVIDLYVNPPPDATVFCVDEKTAIQALDRRDPILPFSPGRAERHGFEYVRNGTLSLFAAFNTQSGAVLAKTVERHTSREFVAFLRELVASQPPGRKIHVILDNLSTHKAKIVREYLKEKSTVTFHFTPTYSSWLNQVELWFSKIQRAVITRGVFTSVKDLAHKLMSYVREYNRAPKPVRWKYRDTSRRIVTP